MTEEKKIKEKYFRWLCAIVMDKKDKSYDVLLRHLHNREFYYIIPMDSNRAEYGIELRYYFGLKNKYSNAIIARYLDVKECSILEVMVALSMFMEEHIMDDPEEGNRTGIWFMNMIESLGLTDMYNENYEPGKIDLILDMFLERKYERNGKGGLFTIRDCKYDLRQIDIWYQANWYLQSIESNS